MPAHDQRPRRHPRRGTHLAALALGASLVAGMGSIVPAPAEARDWSPYIASLRSSQLAYESAMRSADLQIRAVEHALRRTRRAAARAERVVERTRERHEQKKERLAAARLRWTIARARLDAASVAPAAVQGLSAALISAASPPLTEPEAPDLAFATTATLAATSPVELASEARDYVSAVLTARGDLAERSRDMRFHERSVRHSRKRLARVARHERQVEHRVVALKRARRGAIARREGAEGGLGNAILGMSRYAQRRIAKKTNVRPGVTSGFTWPAQGRLTQGYGCTGVTAEPALGSCRHFHDGIDIAGYRGTPIRAAAVGVISYIGWNPWDQQRRAFMVVVAHPGGFETLYGHTLPTRAVRVGQVVKRGQLIGYMGNTGNSSGVHLHLELRRGRVTLNPLAYL